MAMTEFGNFLQASRGLAVVIRNDLPMMLSLSHGEHVMAIEQLRIEKLEGIPMTIAVMRTVTSSTQVQLGKWVGYNPGPLIDINCIDRLRDMLIAVRAGLLNGGDLEPDCREKDDLTWGIGIDLLLGYLRDVLVRCVSSADGITWYPVAQDERSVRRRAAELNMMTHIDTSGECERWKAVLQRLDRDDASDLERVAAGIMSELNNEQNYGPDGSGGH